MQHFSDKKQARSEEQPVFRAGVNGCPDAVFRTIFDHSFHLCMLVDPDGTLIEVNETALKLVNALRRNVVDRAIWKTPWWAGDEAQTVRLKRAIDSARQGEIVQYQDEIRSAGGGSMPVDLSLKPIKNGKGKIAGIILESRDRSKQAAEEEELRRQGAELADIFDHIHMRIFYKDDNNRILRANKAAAHALGMSVDEIEGRLTSELFPEMADKYYRDDVEVIESGQPKLGIVEEFAPAEGERGWIRTDKVPYTDSESGKRYLVAAATDITAEKEAEEALRLSEQRYRTLYNSAPVMMHSVGPDGRLVSVSDYWLEKLEYEREEVIGKISTDFLSPESRKRVISSLGDGFVHRDCRDVEYQYLTKSGKPVDVLISSISEPGEEGKSVRSMAVSVDITDRKKVEYQFIQAQKMESVGQLTSGMAHDFNNLLGVVLGNLQLIERTFEPDDKALKRVKSAQAAVERGAELTRRLLAFSRRQPLEKETIEPNPLVDDLSDMLKRTLGENIRLESHLANSIPRVRTDPSQLESAILNLAVNARDAMPDGGALIIESKLVELDADYCEQVQDLSPGRYVELAVSDTGKGIPKGLIKQVVEPFFTTKETGKGSGLGLSMVFGFMKQTGGHLSIYSEPEVGTTVRLYLPVDESDIHSTVGSETSLAAKNQGGNETVLVVEDQAEVLEIASALLSGLGYRVITASNGPAGLEILKDRDDIDVLFTDMIMPGGMSGADLAMEAREIQPDMPVIFTTGYADAAMLRESKIAEASNLLTKPYLRRDLASMFRRVIEEART